MFSNVKQSCIFSTLASIAESSHVLVIKCFLLFFPFSPGRLETLSEQNGKCICINSFVNTDERMLTTGWAIKQMRIVQG
jgi:hypothetical protein